MADPLSAIRTALLAAGLPSLPSDPDVDLAAYGMDSLAMVLTVGALEKELAIKGLAKAFTPESFKTIRRIEAFVAQVKSSP